MDRLSKIFNKQVYLQTELGKFPLSGNIEWQQYINEQALALIIETSEAIQETRWKSWKKHQEYNSEKFKEEIADCWHFLINLTLSVMNEDELYSIFNKKNDINIDRIKNNY